MSSFLVIPIPESSMAIVEFVLSGRFGCKGGRRPNSLRIRDRPGTNLVQCIRGVRNQLAQEDLLVGINGTDEQAHHMLEISLNANVSAIVGDVMRPKTHT